MDQNNDIRSNGKVVLSLVLASISILGILYSLSSYQTISCSALCVSNFSSKGDYAISATIAYSSGKLKGATILVTINSAYKAAIATNDFSGLQFQAPLRLGINTLRFKYANSEASLSFFYFGEMLYAMLIPLGAIFFLIMRLLASNLSNKNRIIFYFNDEIVPEAEDDGIKYAIDLLEQKTKRAIADLPERISDLRAELNSINKMDGRKRIQKDEEYLSQKIALLGVAKPISGHVSRCPLTKQAIGARILYENAIISGSCISLNSKNARGFIKANNLLLLDDLLINKGPALKLRKGKINLVLFHPIEFNLLSNAVKSYSRSGSILLMMKLNCTLEVLKTW
jgi:hypothetical protein